MKFPVNLVLFDTPGIFTNTILSFTKDGIMLLLGI